MEKTALDCNRAFSQVQLAQMASLVVQAVNAQVTIPSKRLQDSQCNESSKTHKTSAAGSVSQILLIHNIYIPNCNMVGTGLLFFLGSIATFV